MSAAPDRPTLLPVNVDGIPARMLPIPRWAPWRAVWDDKKKKYEKIPHRADRPVAGLSNKSQRGWSSFDSAMQAYLKNISGPPVFDSKGMQIEFGGVGYLMTGPHGLVAVDLDHCVTDGEIAPWAAEVIAKLDSYTELSPSGNGLRIMVEGEVERDWTNHDRGIEVYGGNDARFVTITGAFIAGSPGQVRAPRPGAMDAITARYRKAGNGAQVEDLHLPPLIDPSDLPDLSDLDIPPHAKNFLLEGAEPGRDRSQALFATSIALVQAGLAPDMILSLLENNEYAMEVALDHRRQDYDKALRYLWKDHCNKGTARAAELRQLDLDQFEDVGGTAEAKSETEVAESDSVMGDFDTLEDDCEDLVYGPAASRDLALVKLPRFTPMRPDAFLRRQQASWIIKGFLPRAGLAVIYGQSGSGKTFFVLDMAGCVAQGADWRGHKTAKGKVVYVVAEGASGFRNRLEAYCKHHGIDPAELDIFVIPDTPNLLDKANMKELIAALKTIGGISVIVIDTYARAMVGGNENDAKDTGQAVAHCDVLHRTFKALVVLIHHSGKNVANGARGSGALRAAADLEVEVINNSGDRAAVVTKMKDGEDEKQYGFKLHDVTLGEDEDGFPITSCVIEAKQSTGATRVRIRALTPKQQLVLRVFDDLIGLGLDVHYSDLKRTAVDQLPCDPDKKKDNRNRDIDNAIDALISTGHLESVDGGMIKHVEKC